MIMSISVSNTPVWGDLYDLVSEVTGYDVITGQRLAGWERIVSIIGVIPLPVISGGNLRHGLHAIDAFVSQGVDLVRYVAKQDLSFPYQNNHESRFPNVQYLPTTPPLFR